MNFRHSSQYCKVSKKLYTKKDILDKFTLPNGQLRVVVCSSAFGLGVDRPNERTVVHLKSPDTLIQFVQESGRVGRDGEASKSLLFVDGSEFGHYKAKLTKSSAMKMQFDELESMEDYAINTLKSSAISWNQKTAVTYVQEGWWICECC